MDFFGDERTFDYLEPELLRPLPEPNAVLGETKEHAAAMRMAAAAARAKLKDAR